MYPHQKPRFRKRSISNLIQELIEIKNNLSFIHHITFDDDAFFYPEKDIRVFSEEYKRHVALPLEIRGATPVTLTRKKLALLVDAGLTGIRMGIETGSERTQKLYNRHYSNEQVKKAITIINEFKENIPLPRYDIIINNPWETDEDLIQTLMFLNNIPLPYELNLFSMNFYPGTELYDKAKKEGFITDDLQDVYRKSYNVRADGLSGKLLNESYLNNVLYLLYVYSLNGLKISESKMRTLTNRSQSPLKSQILYTLMRFRAGLLLKKNLLQKLLLLVKEGDREKFENWLHEGHDLD